MFTKYKYVVSYLNQVYLYIYISIIIIIIQWNISCMKKEKYEEIRRIRPHIICFQEIRGYYV